MCQCTPNKRTSFCGKGSCKSPEQMQLIHELNELGRKAGEYDKLQGGGTDPVVNAVCADLKSRSSVGITKYGTTLADNKGDLRYWINHAYEECLDQANYLKRCIMELDATLETIPHDIYYSEGYDNFYSRITLRGKGTEFYDKWKNRKSEFPQG